MTILSELPQRFACLAEETLRFGLEIEGDILAEIHRGDGTPPGRYQAAMVNFCCAIESAAKCILLRTCPAALFNLSGNNGLNIASLIQLSDPNLSPNELSRLILTLHTIGFKAALDGAKLAAPELEYPVAIDILRAARNQATHSLVLNEGREVDLVAVTAIYLLTFIKEKSIADLRYPIEKEDRERLANFQSERQQAAEEAYRILKKIRSKPLARGKPDKFDGCEDTDDRIYVICPLCQVRACCMIDTSKDWLVPGSITIWQPGETTFRIFYPKHYSCPGCGLELNGRAVTEAGLTLRPAPTFSAWQTHDTPLSPEEIQAMCDD